MELYQLNSFLCIAREQNLTRAASRLNLSQSALSTQLRLLEEELGVPLFNRTTRGMILTEEGKVLLAHAQEVLDAAERMRQKAVDARHSARESVRIGINADPGFLRIGIVTRRLSQLHADLNVAFIPTRSSRTVQMLREGEIELGFFYGDVSGHDVRHTVVTAVRIGVAIPASFASAGKSLSWEEVVRLPWIMTGPDSPFFEALSGRFDRHRALPRQLATASDPQVVRELVHDGQGVAILREDEARLLVEKGSVFMWEPGWLTLSMGVAWLDRNAPMAKVGAALEAIRHAWKEDSVALPGSPGRH